MTDSAPTGPRHDQVPDVCPTCGTGVPAGATRCPGCGRVFGEANRCPHCHAIAGVLRRGQGTVCAACGKPRSVGPGTVVLDGGPGAGPSAALAPRTRGLGARALGVGALGMGILGAAVAAVALPGAVGLVAALVVGGVGVALGATALRAGARQAGRARDRATERALLDLARAEGGRLSATRVAERLGWTTREADAALTDLVDEVRVSLEVEPDGRLTYVFKEIAADRDAPGATAGPRVRVAAEPGEETVEAEPTGAERDGETDPARGQAR